MNPITRKEYYLAKAAGTYTGLTPTPVMREDYYLATLAGDYSGNCPAPVTRLDMFMFAAAGITSYVPQPITRIEMYWYAIAKGAGYVPEPVKREEKFLYAVLKNSPKPEWLDKTAEGSTILLTESAKAPLTALTIYGHSIQDGTPSPENPVPIVSAGSVMTTGAQLLNANVSGVSRGVTYQVNGSIVHFSGITNESTGRVAGNVNMLDVLQAGKTYYAKSFTDNVSADFAVTDNDVDSYVSSYTVTGTETRINFRLLLDDTANISGINVERTVYGGVTENQNMESWEPYTGGIPGVNPYEGEINVTVSDGGTQSQILTLFTPGGLPGIPVTSGGNYMDESGQQWVCDEIDLERGKYVQRVELTQKTLPYDWSQHRYSVGNVKYARTEVICAQLTYNVSAGNNIVGVRNSPDYDTIVANTEEGVNWETEEPPLSITLDLLLQLREPIETDLTAEEISAYKALHTYSPTTTVGNDAEAWMKVGYKATS